MTDHIHDLLGGHAGGVVGGMDPLHIQGLCWPLDSSDQQPAQQASHATSHSASVILNGDMAARAMRSPRAHDDAVMSGHGLVRRLSWTVHEYPRCCILMRQEEPALCRCWQGLTHATR